MSFWPDATVVGSSFRRPLLDKAAAVWSRARELAEHVRPARPDGALSHNSYSHLIAGRLLRIPTVTAMDYEHQPANHLAFRVAHHVLLPEAIPLSAVRKYGCTARRLLHYQGLKEEITLSTFRPDPGFRSTLGLDEADRLVTVRPPPDGALYHRGPNTALDGLLRRLCTSGASVVLSPRTRSQAEHFRAMPGVKVLQQPVSGPDLLFHSDIVIGAGGTMTREAAVLGTRTFTMFQGRRPAVDQLLIDDGRLEVIERPDDFIPPDNPPGGPRLWEPNLAPLLGFVRRVLEALDTSESPEDEITLKQLLPPVHVANQRNEASP